MFQKDSVKTEVCKDILKCYVHQQKKSTSDPVITGALMSICKMMHDSVKYELHSNFIYFVFFYGYKEGHLILTY